jgi:hypothetical protein
MAISDLRSDYVALFAAALPTADVVARDGRLDATEIKRWSMRPPVVAVTLLGIDGAPSVESIPEQVTVRLRWGMFLLASSTAGAKRGDNCLEMLQAAMSAVRLRSTYSDTGARQIADLRADSLYGGDIDKQGIAIWAVSWTQLYDLYSP